MYTAAINYLGELRTEMQHLASGQKVITDAPLDNQGKGEAFSPTDLVSAAFCSCMLTIMGISIRNHGMEVTGIEAKVTKHMQANPRKIAKLEATVTISGNLNDKQKAILEAAARSCPVALSLHPDLEQVLHFEFLS